MKMKKYSYIMLFILMLFLGINGVYAGECETYFGTIDPNDGVDSLREIMQEILLIPKIIVPVIIIVLGILDFAKAVIASKEDEMRKAQSTFVKRVLIGVAVFFIPTIINLLMYVMELILGTSINCL